MKKIFILVALAAAAMLPAQIKILKNENLVEVGAENLVTLYRKNNKYTFNYQDVNSANLNTFRSFSFSDLNKDFDVLYKLISDGFIDMPVTEITLELPNDIVGLNFAKNYGQTTVQFVHYINKSNKYIGKSRFLTKKDIDKLFGKDKPAQALRREIVDPRESGYTFNTTPVPPAPATKKATAKK